LRESSSEAAVLFDTLHFPVSPPPGRGQLAAMAFPTLLLPHLVLALFVRRTATVFSLLSPGRLGFFADSSEPSFLMTFFFFFSVLGWISLLLLFRVYPLSPSPILFSATSPFFPLPQVWRSAGGQFLGSFLPQCFLLFFLCCFCACFRRL